MKLHTLLSFNYVWSKDIIINIFFLSLVFRMVESEEEYVDQLEILISCFLRPFKMAASSKNPPCTHEDINSIFLNSETVLFLHQIFLKGLTARMESWPTLVLGTSLGGNIQIRYDWWISCKPSFLPKLVVFHFRTFYVDAATQQLPT